MFTQQSGMPPFLASIQIHGHLVLILEGHVHDDDTVTWKVFGEDGSQELFEVRVTAFALAASVMQSADDLIAIHEEFEAVCNG